MPLTLRRAVLVLTPLLAAFSSESCSPTQPTAFVLAISTDAAPSELDEVRIILAHAGATQFDTSYSLDRREIALPGTLTAVRQTDGADPLVARVEARRGVAQNGVGDDRGWLVVRDVRATFSEGKTKLLRVGLERSCFGVECVAPQTCIHGTCTDEGVIDGDKLDDAAPIGGTFPPIQGIGGAGGAGAGGQSGAGGAGGQGGAGGGQAGTGGKGGSAGTGGGAGGVGGAGTGGAAGTGGGGAAGTGGGGATGAAGTGGAGTSGAGGKSGTGGAAGTAGGGTGGTSGTAGTGGLAGTAGAGTGGTGGASGMAGSGVGGCSPGNCVQTVSSMQGSVKDIAVDATHAYWVADDPPFNTGNMQIRRALKDGSGTVTNLTPVTPNLFALALGDTDVFFQNANELHQIAKTANLGASVMFGSHKPGAYLASGEGRILWSNNAEQSNTFDGTMPQSAVSSMGTTVPYNFAVRNGYVYWVDRAVVPFTGWRAEVSTGMVDLIAPAVMGVLLHSVAVDDNNAYFTDGSLTGGIVQCSITGSGCTPLVSMSGQNLQKILYDSGFIYWVNHSDGNGTIDSGQIWRCDVNDCPGTLVALAQNEDKVQSVAVDETYVYWASQAGGTTTGLIRRVFK